MTGWGQLVENFAGQAEEFTYACFLDHETSYNQNVTAEMTTPNPFRCKWPHNTKEISPVASAILLQARDDLKMQFYHLWFRTTQSSWEYMAHQKGMSDGFFFLNQIK